MGEFNIEELREMKKAELVELAEDMDITLPSKATKEVIINLLMPEETEEIEEVEEVEEVEVAESGPTLIREGPLSGEYHFEGINGSIAARSLEEAHEKARELLLKNPGVLK